MSLANGFSESYSGEESMISRLALSSLNVSVPSCCSCCSCSSAGVPVAAPATDEVTTLDSKTLAMLVSTMRCIIPPSPQSDSDLLTSAANHNLRQQAIRRAALITLHRAICQRFPPRRERQVGGDLRVPKSGHPQHGIAE